MSMYEILHGRNPHSEAILAAIGLSETKVGRFRNVFVSNGEVHVYTRNGGGNRTCSEKWERDGFQDKPSDVDCGSLGCFGCTITHRLPKHPLYIRDWDDEFDSTYATIAFRIPDEAKAAMAVLDEGPVDMDERWRTMIDKLKSGDPELMDKLEPIRKKLQEMLLGNGPNIMEV